MAVATGRDFAVIVTEDGNICTSGDNMYGQLGVGDFVRHEEPCLLKHVDTFGGHEVVMVAVAGFMCACVTKDGSLWTWGENTIGVLGQPMAAPVTEHLQSRPRRLCMSLHGDSPVLMVACGENFVLVLTISGEIWSFGQGMRYELGHGIRETSTVPKRIDPAAFDNAKIGMIAAGRRHCLALSKTGGRVWSWGLNSMGQTGAGSEYVEGDPGYPPWWFVRVPTLIPAAVLGGGSVVFVSCGPDFSALVTVDGVVWACGSNAYNECGLGDNVDDSHVFQRVGGEEYFGAGGVRMVSCGSSHTILLAKDNTVWTYGCGAHGELASAYTTDALAVGASRRPHRVDFSIFHNSDSEGSQDNDIVVVTAGRQCSFAITSGGSVYLWGSGHNRMFRDLQKAYNQPTWVPCMLPARVLGLADNSVENARAGRWHYIHHDAMIAFIMGTQPGFAVNTPRPSNSMFPGEMLRGLFRGMRFAPRQQTSHGTRALLGLEDDQ